ncbi:MAG: hypothetical protein ABGX16_09695, partial [Pirellulales bacterium]
MEGLLSSHQMGPDGKYRALAERMAEQMMKWQHDSGYWSYYCLLRGSKNPRLQAITSVELGYGSVLRYRAKRA